MGCWVPCVAPIPLIGHVVRCALVPPLSVEEDTVLPLNLLPGVVDWPPATVANRRRVLHTRYLAPSTVNSFDLYISIRQLRIHQSRSPLNTDTQ